MGWTDNLDEELEMENRPGPSGLRPSDTVASEGTEEDLDMENQPGRSRPRPSDTVASETEADDEDPIEENPYQVFSEKVTIAGLVEAYSSHIPADKLMFRLSLPAAFAAIIYLSIITGQRYADLREVVFDDKEIAGQSTPFPNISVCYPTFRNETLWFEMMEVSKKAAALYKMHNLIIRDTTEFIQRVAFWDVKREDLISPLYAVTRMIWDDTLRKGVENNRSMFDGTVAYCPSVLGNCVLDGQTFDCCQVAKPMDLWQSPCYHVDMNNTQNRIMKAESVLSLDVSIDWTTAVYPDNETASDGFHVFVDTIPSQLKVPISVPAQMDVWIVLSQPTKTIERSGCLDQGKELALFDYYDPHGVQCFDEEFLHVLEGILGCHISAGSYYPVNHSCALAQLFALSLASSDLISTFKNQDPHLMMKFEKLRKIQRSMEDSVRYLASDKSPCKPLCSRWTYPIFSVSYSLITYREFDTEKQSNRSWNLMPLESYTSHKELHTAMWYIALCDIGGMMGVYAGISMVTFVQIIAYGIYVIWFKITQRPAVITEENSVK